MKSVQFFQLILWYVFKTGGIHKIAFEISCNLIKDEDDTKVSEILEIESEEDFDETYEIDVEYLTAASAKRKLVFLKSKADRKIIVGGKQKFEVLKVNNKGAKYELKTPKFVSMYLSWYIIRVVKFSIEWYKIRKIFA